MLHFQASFVGFAPPGLIEALKNTRADFGFLGANGAFRIVAGFSFWVGLSMILLGVHNLLVLRGLPVGHRVRRQALTLSCLWSAVFFCLASYCFIYPAAAGGAIATLFFALGLRAERRPGPHVVRAGVPLAEVPPPKGR